MVSYFPTRNHIALTFDLHPLQKYAPKVMHRIIQQGASSVRFFQLRELPGELLRRTLESFAEKGYSLRHSLRAVRSEGVGGGLSFNGSHGVPLRQGADDHVKDWTGPPIPLYLDLTMPLAAEPIRSNSQDKTNTWAHSSEKPRVLNWVRGLDDSMEATETATAAPSDARNMMAKPAEQVAVMGRARVVKEGMKAESDSGSDSDSEDKPIKAKGFSQLMGLGKQRVEDSEEESDSTSDVNQPSIYTNLFYCKGATKIPAKALENATDPGTKTANDETVASKPISSPYDYAALFNEPTTGQSASQVQPYNTKAFSKVDKIGLTADPAAQAKWEIDNYRLRGARRAQESAAQSSSAVSTTHASLTGDRSFKEIPLAPRVQEQPVNNYKQTQFDSKAWEKNVAHLRPVAEGGLIDTSTDTTPRQAISSQTAFPTPVQARGILKTQKEGSTTSIVSSYPSDWVVRTFPQYRISDSSDLLNTQRPQSTLMTGEACSTTQPIASVSTPPTRPSSAVMSQLIDYSENRTPEPLSRTMTPSASLLCGLPAATLTTPAPSQGAGQTQSLLDFDDAIDERLQAPMSDLEKERKNTMGQQAARKAKGGNKSGGLPKVELPKPEAAPASPSKTLKSKAQNAAKPQPSQQQQTPLPPMQRPIARTAHNSIKHMLMQGLQASEEDRIEVQFGIILNREGEGKSNRPKYMTLSDIEAKLNTAGTSTLNTRLSNTPYDANHIIDLGRQFLKTATNDSMPLDAASIKAQEVYEVHLLTDLGGHDIYNLDVPNGRITIPGATVSELYLHFPARVWDARVRVLQESRQKTDIMHKFLINLETEPGARKEGLATFSTIRQDEVTIGRVFYKRIYTLPVLPHVELKVTDCRRLLATHAEFEPGTVKFMDADEGEMILAQRRWWEASISTAVRDTDKFDGPSGLLQHLITGMDGVGWYNWGPRGAKQLKPERQVVQNTQNFW